MASTYDAVASLVSLGRWRVWTEAVLPFVVGPRILEIGYGTGHLMARLSHDRGVQAVGLDESRQMARLAQRRTPAAVLLLRGMAQHLPLSAGGFNTVVSTFPSEYIADPETLSEIHRVLVPGGRLVVLPLARIVGRTRPGRGAAWPSRFLRGLPSTAVERPATLLVKMLSESAFQVSTHGLELRASFVLLVVAVKSPGSP